MVIVRFRWRFPLLPRQTNHRGRNAIRYLSFLHAWFYTYDSFQWFMEFRAQAFDCGLYYVSISVLRATLCLLPEIRVLWTGKKWFQMEKIYWWFMAILWVEHFHCIWLLFYCFAICLCVCLDEHWTNDGGSKWCPTHVTTSSQRWNWMI